jgi:uncharacterized membrane protein
MMERKYFNWRKHALLTIIPIGILSLSLIFDVVYILSGNIYLSQIAFYMIAVGIIGGFIGAIVGLIDWMEIPHGTFAKRLGLWHGVGNAIFLTLFIISWFLRTDLLDTPNSYSLITAVIALLIALVEVKIGSHLARRVETIKVRSPQL